MIAADSSATRTPRRTRKAHPEASERDADPRRGADCAEDTGLEVAGDALVLDRADDANRQDELLSDS
jgi:hypothetical protein